MRRTTPLGVALALLLALAIAPGGARAAPNEGSGDVVIPIAFRTNDAAQSQGYLPTGSQYLQPQTDKPEGDWKLPKLVAEEPRYALVDFGGQDRLVVLEKQAKGSEFYDRILYDANGNGDLTDDPKIDGEVVKIQGNQTYRRSTFSPVQTKVAIDGKETPFCFQPNLYGYLTAPSGQLRSVQLSFTSQCSYAGEFARNGTKYRVVLADTDANGVFDDKPGYRTIAGTGRRVMRRGDYLFVTKRDTLLYYDSAPLADLVSIGGKAYSVETNVPEGKIVLKPATGLLLPVRLAGEADTMLLAGPDGKTIAVYDPSQTIELPPGDYRLQKYTAYKKDDQGDLWMLSASASSQASVTEVKSGQTPIVQFGGPYKASITAPVSGIPKEGPIKTAQLSFGIVGSGGERVSALSHVEGNSTEIAMSKRNPDRPIEPQYKIVKSDGETVTQGSFEYG